MGDGLQSAAPIREHLEHLRGIGVGLRAVATASGISRSLLQRIRTGKVTKVHPETARAILGCSGFDRAGGAVLDEAGSLRAQEMLDELLEEGVPKVEIATRVAGYRRRQLQLSQRVLRRHGERLEILHWGVWRASPRFRERCGHEAPVARAAELVR